MGKSSSTLFVTALVLATPSAVRADEPRPTGRVVLVELFTSQGCSSCPPADAFVRDFPRLGLGRDKVLPLTFHVDYWDRLGWKDRFALPSFTQRQVWYASLPGLRSARGGSDLTGPYTPQMIIDGRVHFPGSRRDDGFREIARAAARAPAFALVGRAILKGATLEVKVDVTDGERERPGESWELRVALTSPAARTVVTRGENAGETLNEAAIVRSLSEPIPLPRSSNGTLTVTLPVPADVPWSSAELVAFVQSAATGEIGAAVAVDKSGRP